MELRRVIGPYMFGFDSEAVDWEAYHNHPMVIDAIVDAVVDEARKKTEPRVVFDLDRFWDEDNYLVLKARLEAKGFKNIVLDGYQLVLQENPYLEEAKRHYSYRRLVQFNQTLISWKRDYHTIERQHDYDPREYSVRCVYFPCRGDQQAEMLEALKLCGWVDAWFEGELISQFSDRLVVCARRQKDS